MILLLFRMANYLSKKRFFFYLGFPYLIFYKLFVEWVLCIEIPWNVKIGKNLCLYHGQSLVIANDVVIGENCSLRHCTTIGNKQLSKEGYTSSPIIGDNVDIGSNVCIIGDIIIGNNVKIGSGSVVVKNISDNCVVVGNPAQVKKILLRK